MDPRFPFEGAPDPTARQLMEESLTAMYGGAPPFRWISDDGKSLLGCYGPLCYSSLMAPQFFALARTSFKPEVVKPRNRELAILGLASVLNAPYIVYCHRLVAEKVGLTHEQYEDAVAGRVPNGLSDEESMAYRLGRILTSLSGPLDDQTWQEAISKMTKSEIVGIVHIVGGYRWVALLEQVNGTGGQAV